MKWFVKHKAILIILILVILSTSTLLVSYNNQDKPGSIGSISSRIISAVQWPITKVVNLGKDFFGNLFVDESLISENQDLKAKLRELESEIIATRMNKEALEELRAISEVLNYENEQLDYDVVSGDVIALDGSNYYNIFTINLGSDKGVKINSVVVGESGLIGRVISTTPKTSKVIGIIDESNKIGFQLSRDLKLLGVAQGDGKGKLTGFMLNDDALVKKGDILLTTDIGGIYPPGLTIGKVVDIDLTHDSPLKKVTIEPATDFKGIRKVSVLI